MQKAVNFVLVLFFPQSVLIFGQKMFLLWRFAETVGIFMLTICICTRFSILRQKVRSSQFIRFWNVCLCSPCSDLERRATEGVLEDGHSLASTTHPLHRVEPPCRRRRRRRRSHRREPSSPPPPAVEGGDCTQRRRHSCRQLCREPRRGHYHPQRT